MLLSSSAFTCERGIKANSAETTIHKPAKYNPSLRMVILLILRSPQPKWAGWASPAFSSRSVNLHGRISRPETQKAESPLVALTLPLAATRPSLSPLGLEPLKDPWLSVPCSRRVWPYRIFRIVADQGKGLASFELARGLLSWGCTRRCARIVVPVACRCQVKFFLDSDASPSFGPCGARGFGLLRPCARAAD